MIQGCQEIITYLNSYCRHNKIRNTITQPQQPRLSIQNRPSGLPFVHAIAPECRSQSTSHRGCAGFEGMCGEGRAGPHMHQIVLTFCGQRALFMPTLFLL